MSFIAGYILGGGGRVKETDSRVGKLERTPDLWTFDIAEGWEVRVKLAYDVDNMQFFSFGPTHGGIIDYVSFWSLYYCIYKDGSFRYASCDANFLPKYHESYENLDVPDRLTWIYEYSDIVISSGSMTLKNCFSDFLDLSIEGSYVMKRTPYSWNDESECIEGETETRVSSFGTTRCDFGGNQFKGNYVINGGAEEFRNSVYGLYAVCRSHAGE
ncbi:MAG: hypothetical protein ACI4J0_05000 [Huintestinicola sp.]|uniref:hypothetical protein n=1 Tax=Huintestinicola sp. TaxID=2981661 RepID=UPI003F09A602